MGNQVSHYARQFNDNNPNWTNIYEYNLMFVKMVQNLLNDRLRLRGHVFLNELYDELGIERMFPEGQLDGWILEPWRQMPVIQIEIDIHDPDHILLDFNPQANVIDKLV